MWSAIEQHISEASGSPFTSRVQRSVGGGCINSTYILEGSGPPYFVKLNQVDKLDMFEAEAEGLRDLGCAKAIRVPRPVCWGYEGDMAFLVMEYLELGRGRSEGLAAERLGRELAQLHRSTDGRYGWRMENTIGSTPQVNTPAADWVAFFREHRLLFQFRLAARNGYGGYLQRKGERLAASLPAFFERYTPVPSLLHGDLWSGNYAVDEQGNPVIFDPAVYYGDREADLAMTELFGGFPQRFYAAYREAWPLDEGYGVRKTLYNLYHILNHLNLFGSGYRPQAEHMLDALLSHIEPQI